MSDAVYLAAGRLTNAKVAFDDALAAWKDIEIEFNRASDLVEARGKTLLAAKADLVAAIAADAPQQPTGAE